MLIIFTCNKCKGLYVLYQKIKGTKDSLIYFILHSSLTPKSAPMLTITHLLTPLLRPMAQAQHACCKAL